MEPVLEEKTDLWYWQKTSALGLFLFIWKSLDLTNVHKYISRITRWQWIKSLTIVTDFLLRTGLQNFFCSTHKVVFKWWWVWIQEFTSEEIFTGRDDRMGDTLIIKTTCSLRKQTCYLHSCRNNAENKL